MLSEHRGVLKAISDAASGDGDMERTYRAFMQSCWIDDLTSRLVDAQAEGRAAGLDPHLGGEALGWMAERMVTQSLDRDPGQVLDTIVTILVRCIYGRRPTHRPPRSQRIQLPPAECPRRDSFSERAKRTSAKQRAARVPLTCRRAALALSELTSPTSEPTRPREDSLAPMLQCR